MNEIDGIKLIIEMVVECRNEKGNLDREIFVHRWLNRNTNNKRSVCVCVCRLRDANNYHKRAPNESNWDLMLLLCTKCKQSK